MPTCQGKTKAGARCRAAASKGGLCFFHANPQSARTLGQIGGRQNRRSPVDLEVPDNMNAAQLCDVTGKAMRLLLAGEMGAREASAFAQLCNSLQRVLPTADLEARVAILENQLCQEVHAPHVEDRVAPEIISSASPKDENEFSENEIWPEREPTDTGSLDTIMEVDQNAAPFSTATEERVEQPESPDSRFSEGEEPS